MPEAIFNPASFLKAEVSINLMHQSKRYPKYSGYIFNNESRRFRSIKKNIFNGMLDKNGNSYIEWTLPPLDNVPSAINAQIIAKVFEKGGRASRNTHTIPIDPYKNYIGLEKPKFKYGYSTEWCYTDGCMDYDNSWWKT